MNIDKSVVYYGVVPQLVSSEDPRPSVYILSAWPFDDATCS